MNFLFCKHWKFILHLWCHVVHRIVGPLGAHLPLLDLWAHRWYKPWSLLTHGQCDTRPTVTFLASKHHRPFHYSIIESKKQRYQYRSAAWPMRLKSAAGCTAETAVDKCWTADTWMTAHRWAPAETTTPTTSIAGISFDILSIPGLPLSRRKKNLWLF